MRQAIFIFFSVTFFYANGQVDEPKFGKIPKEILDFNHLEIDSSAAAVKLFDFGVSSLNYVQSTGWQLEFTRHMAIKVVSKDGYDWANHEVSLYHDGGSKERISQIKGYTYNLDKGKYVKTKLEKSSIFDEETNEYWDKIKIAMPEVKEGAILEIQYRVTSDFWFNFRAWQFQSSIPVLHSEYLTIIPQYFTYRKFSQGYFPLFINETEQQNKTITLTSTQRTGSYATQSKLQTQNVSYRETRNKLAAKNIPAMKDETFVSSLKNYVLKVDFELQSTQFPGSSVKDYRNTWESLNESFVKNNQLSPHLLSEQ
jgi:hypothetical protein